MVALLLIAAPTYWAIGETSDAVVAFVALIPIIAVGWVVEQRAERTLEQLRALTAPTALLIRDGVQARVPTEEIVPGDLLVLQEGDIIPADGVVVSSTQLMVDESALTGESLPVAKTDADDERDVFTGTTVLSGRAYVTVTVTGPATRYGKVGALVAAATTSRTPLQRALARLVGALSVVAAVFCVAVVLAQLWHGKGWGEAIIAGVSLAIAAIPEEFSMVYTLYLALGAWRLAHLNALVRRLPSVETLGSTTVICTDKTGTLTQGRLAVGGVWPVDASISMIDVMRAAVLSSEPSPFDPLDIAITEYAGARGVDVDQIHGGEFVADWPFDPVDKYLTHVWRDDGEAVVAAKGAIEGVLRHVDVDEATVARLTEQNERFAADGMRVIAVAGGPAGAHPGAARETDEAQLRILGLVAFVDPVRDGVPEALAECRAAGVRVIMITGDHPATAHAVAEGLQLPHDDGGVDLIATGADLDAADPAELDRLVATANVFARTRPEQKHFIIDALRRRGEVVAMTGDGINDAPALREADIGVAMGQRGTVVAREAAALVLVDDNFSTIVSAVRDGRRIFDNLVRAFAYLIAFHPPLLFAALVIPLLDRPLLLLPVHLVLLEIVLHPVVSLVFQADPADDDVMRRPPRPVADALRLRTMWRPYAVGLVLAVALIAEYLVALRIGWPVGEARALGFATLLAAQPFLLLATRSPDRPWWRGVHRWTPTLWSVLGVLLVVTVAAVEFGPLARMLQLQAFAPSTWLVVVAIALVSTSWGEPFKRRSSAGVRQPVRR
jgi:Ca2+-transporting ATPase